MILVYVFTAITVIIWLTFLCFSFTRLGHLLQPYYFIIGYLILSTVLTWLSIKKRKEVLFEKETGFRYVGQYIQTYILFLLISLFIMIVFYLVSKLFRNAFDGSESAYVQWWNTQISEESIPTKILILIYFGLSILGILYLYSLIFMYFIDSNQKLRNDIINMTMIIVMFIFSPAILYVMEKYTGILHGILKRYNEGKPFMYLFKSDVLFENMQLWDDKVTEYVLKTFLTGLFIVLMTMKHPKVLHITLVIQAFINLFPGLRQVLDTYMSKHH